MDEIINHIKNLAKIRNKHQFLFIDDINRETVIQVREKIRELKQKDQQVKDIDFIINSPGGGADDAYRIIRTLRKSFKYVNIIVPFWAKSAATLLCIGGSQIIMDEFGEFGPLDVQIAKEMNDRPNYERESALIDENSLNRIETHSKKMYQEMFTNLYEDEYIRIHKNELSKQIFDYIAKFYEPLLKQINPYKLGEKKRKLDIGEQYASRILSLYNPELSREKRIMFVDYLINGCPDHGYIIDYDLIARFLPNVKKSSEISTEFEKEIKELSSCFMLGKENNFVDFILNKNEEIIVGSDKSFQQTNQISK